MIDYNNPRATEYIEKFNKLQIEFEHNTDSSDEIHYIGKDGSSFDRLSKEFHKRIKSLQNEYKDIFIQENI